MTRLRDPAFYLMHRDGAPLETDIVVPEERRRQRAFFLYSNMPRLQEYLRLSQTDLRGYNIMSFETVEDVDQFVELHRNLYEWVVVNPQLGERSGMEPFEQLPQMARGLAVQEPEGEGAELRDPAFYIRRVSDGYPLQTELPEGVTMPVFSRSEAAPEWMRAYGLDYNDYRVEGFYTLNDVRRFVENYESGYQYITINPVPDPNVPPNIQPFSRLLPIAESAARSLPEPTEAPVAPDTGEGTVVAGTLDGTPVEILESLRYFQQDHPDPAKTAFIMMEFGDSWAHAAIANAIKEVLEKHGIEGVRADDKRYHDHLYFNVQTYMHGCGMGVAVHDRIKADSHNPNVALEVGYLFALRKPVCLLKEKTLATLPTDLVGWMYEPFDTLNPGETIPLLVSKWLSDKGLT
ncbi:MAG: hypothetical protein WKF67_07540 [Rubrobacteraceae bacterium]